VIRKVNLLFLDDVRTTRDGGAEEEVHAEEGRGGGVARSFFGMGVKDS
jgi:hypothetical protein